MKSLIDHMREDIELIDKNLEQTPEVRTYFEGHERYLRGRYAEAEKTLRMLTTLSKHHYIMPNPMVRPSDGLGKNNYN